MKLQHYILGRAAKSKDYDKPYFDSLICKTGSRTHGSTIHYELEKSTALETKCFLRHEVKFCPKCGCQLRTKNAASSPHSKMTRERTIGVRY